jgi:hypothetical protein
MSKKQPPRPPMSKDALRIINAQPRLPNLKFYPEEIQMLREINQERAKLREERSARLQIEETPILADLASVGINIRSIWDLVNTATPYPQAIPILLDHLRRPYSDRTREGIARSLAVYDANSAWPLLAAEYVKAKEGYGVVAPGDTEVLCLGAKDGLACAVAQAATEREIPQLAALALDRSNGASRVLLLRRLKRSKSEVAKQALEVLASDPHTMKEIASWRKPKPKPKAS